MRKLLSYSDGISKTLKAQLDNLLNEVAQAARRQSYERTLDLNPVLRGLSSAELVPPNLINPSEDDIAITVHLLARLEAEAVYETTKVSTGMYSYDFLKRIRLVHCMSQEYNILMKQMKIKYPKIEATENAK